MGQTLNHVEVLTLVAVARLGDAAYGVTIREDISTCAGPRRVDGGRLRARSSSSGG